MLIHSEKETIEGGVLQTMRAADNASVKWDDSVVDLYHEVLGTADQDWIGHDPNLVRSATMFWLRRTKDGTATLFFDGLTKLLSTYDKPWLDALTQAKPGPLPQRPPDAAKPEYR